MKNMNMTAVLLCNFFFIYIYLFFFFWYMLGDFGRCVGLILDVHEQLTFMLVFSFIFSIFFSEGFISYVSGIKLNQNIEKNSVLFASYFFFYIYFEINCSHLLLMLN